MTTNYVLKLNEEELYVLHGLIGNLSIYQIERLLEDKDNVIIKKFGRDRWEEKAIEMFSEDKLILDRVYDRLRNTIYRLEND